MCSALNQFVSDDISLNNEGEAFSQLKANVELQDEFHVETIGTSSIIV